MELLAIVFCAMVYMHIIDDFYLQGILADMKQKSRWEDLVGGKEILNNSQYKKDYIAALVIHGLSWALSVHLPLFIHILYTGNIRLVIPTIMSVLASAYIHTDIDNEKANKKSINLVEDQIFHLFQLIAIFVAYIVNTNILYK